MTAKVVVTDYTFPELTAEAAAAASAGAEFAAHQCKTADEVIEAVRGATVAVVQFAPFPAAAVDVLAPKAAVIRYGIGYDNIAVAAAHERNIAVGYVPDYCREEVADHTAAALLSCLRKLPALDASVRRGEWKAVAVAKPVRPFSETTVGFFGYGQIARNVHDRLKPFGFQFAASDPMLDEPEASRRGVALMNAETLFSSCDAVSLHAPANPETAQFVNRDRFASMRPHAVIVNTARGVLINEPDLAEALHQGVIGAAALDVFGTEPLPADSPLRDAPNLLMTPHAAWYSDAAIGRLQRLVAADIANHLAGRPLRQPVPGSI
jgi:D-3-phosphoglycerate dehydrogenase